MSEERSLFDDLDHDQPTREVILATLDNYRGDEFYSLNLLVAVGYPRAFLTPLAQTCVDDPEEGRSLVNAFTGKAIEHMYGVHALDLLEALMHSLGASVPEEDPDGAAFGQKRRARAYRRAIRRALGAGEGE